MKDGRISFYLTKKQRDVLVILGRYYDQGDIPSYTEVAHGLKKRNPSQAWFVVDALKKLGLVEDNPKQHRSMRLTPFGRRCWQALRGKFGEEAYDASETE